MTGSPKPPVVFIVEKYDFGDIRTSLESLIKALKSKEDSLIVLTFKGL